MTEPAPDDTVEGLERKWFPIIEAKVKSATVASTVTGIIVTGLGEYVFHGSSVAWLVPIVGGVVTGAFTFVAGWLSKHTPR